MMASHHAKVRPGTIQGFPPIADRRARVLILGSMPGEASLAAGEYYAYRHNQFWRIAGEIAGFAHDAPYALERIHKHVPEITVYAGLAQPPQFLPAVGPFRCGMRVSLPLHASLLASGATPKRVWDVLADRYRDEPFVRVAPLADPPATDEHSLDPRALNDTNAVELAVLANAAGHLLLVARLDNLGKGAAGSAIQNLNLMLGLGEGTGLRG